MIRSLRRWKFGRIYRWLRKSIMELPFRWKFGRIYRWPWHRLLAWLIFNDGRYIDTGKKFKG